LDISRGNKSILERRYKMVEQGFESVSKYFGDDLERNA
jgi:hypothetical protein